MKLEVKTVYYNLDEKWLEWYLKRMENTDVLPGCQSIVAKLRKDAYAEFTSDDPTGPTKAITTYTIIRKDNT